MFSGHFDHYYHQNHHYHHHNYHLAIIVNIGILFWHMRKTLFLTCKKGDNAQKKEKIPETFINSIIAKQFIVEYSRFQNYDHTGGSTQEDYRGTKKLQLFQRQ